MGLLTEIDQRLKDFIESQHVFFVATAPLGPGGHVNVSPKGIEALRVLGPTEVAYADYPGSGVETIAHLRENGRIVIMLCAFTGPPRVVRLHGRGIAIEPPDPGFEELRFQLGPEAMPTRSIIRVEVERVSDSCGFGVPLYEFREQRTQLARWAEKKGAAGIRDYQRSKNARSIDGLAGLRRLEQERPEQERPEQESPEQELREP
jgi:hypothetical protein